MLKNIILNYKITNIIIIAVKKKTICKYLRYLQIEIGFRKYFTINRSTGVMIKLYTLLADKNRSLAQLRGSDSLMCMCVQKWQAMNYDRWTRTLNDHLLCTQPHWIVRQVLFVLPILNSIKTDWNPSKAPQAIFSTPRKTIIFTLESTNKVSIIKSAKFLKKKTGVGTYIMYLCK